MHKSESASLKILHVVSTLNIGGAERFVIDLCKAQKSLGLDPAVMSFGSDSDPLVQSCKENNIPVIRINGSIIVKQFQLYLAMRNQLILHVHSPSALRACVLAIKLLRQKEIIYTRHGAAPLRGLRWIRMHRLIRKHIGLITFVSHEGRENFMSTYNWTEKPNKVIANGVDTDELLSNVLPIRASKSMLRLGVVGRLIPLKSQITLLESLSDLPEEIQTKIQVHFFGEGECKDSLEAFSKEKLKNVMIVFHGNVSDRSQIYNSFDLLVMTSKTEGLSLAIIESMATGRAAVATSVGDTALLVSAETGWLFQYGDRKKLTEILTSIADTPEDLFEYGKRASEHIRKNFSIKRVATEYSNSYREIVKNH